MNNISYLRNLLIFMASREKREMKPYAVPLRVLPFHSISDQKVRVMRDELKDAVIARGERR